MVKISKTVLLDGQNLTIYPKRGYWYVTMLSCYHIEATAALKGEHQEVEVVQGKMVERRCVKALEKCR